MPTVTRSSGPTIRELEALRAMIETRKLAAAASQLGLTQSAVSRAIDSLGRKVGRVIFRHEAGRLTPTADAFALNTLAEPVFEGLAKVAIWPEIAAEPQTLRIATSPTFAQHLLPRLIADFQQIEPTATVAVEILTGAQVVSAVAETQVDIGLIGTAGVHAGVRAEPFREAFVHAMMPSGHPLASGGDIAPDDLAGQPLIVQSRRFDVRGDLDRAFARAGVMPRYVSEAVTSGFAVESFTRRGLGIALVSPYPMTLDPNPGVAARRFVPLIPQLTVLLLPGSGPMSLVAGRFRSMVHARREFDRFSRPLP